MSDLRVTITFRIDDAMFGDEEFWRDWWTQRCESVKFANRHVNVHDLDVEVESVGQHASQHGHDRTQQRRSQHEHRG